MKASRSNMMFLIGCLVLMSGMIAFALPVRRTEKAFGKLVADKAELKISKGPTRGGQTDMSGFRLTNVGGRTVTILSVRASCGCAKAEATEKIVEAGRHAFIRVDVDPVEIGVKPVVIVVETDSPITPAIGLQLNVLGWRKPPYLFQSKGDLYYRQTDDLADARDIVAETIQPATDSAQPPKLSTDLSFLTFDKPTVSSGTFTGDPSFMVHSFRFRPKFASKLRPNDTFDGLVRVQDPWDPLRVQNVAVHFDARPDLSASPARVVLTSGRSADGKAAARFLVRSSKPEVGLQVSLEDGKNSPLEVIASADQKDPKLRFYEIHIRPGLEVESKTYHVTIQSDDRSLGKVTLPVLVRREE